jgi:hypothetical protein
MRPTGRNHPRWREVEGLRFGNLTVLKDLTLTDRVRKLLVRCDCGEEFITNKSSVTGGSSTSCGTGMCHANTKDITGQRFGYLLVLRFSRGKSKKNYGTFWECRCDCGKVKDVTYQALIQQEIKSCGCMSGITYSLKVTRPDNLAKIRELLCRYRAHARKLKISFDLTEGQIQKLVLQPCHYCGVEWSNVSQVKNLTTWGEFRHNGVDRKDSKEGYYIDNCVPCCKDCNYAKRKLSYTAFIELALRIAQRHRSLQDTVTTTES